jgi:hypothetical protein
MTLNISSASTRSFWGSASLMWPAVLATCGVNAMQCQSAYALRLFSAVGVTVPFIFVSRAMFPNSSEPKSLETHYMEQRKVLLLALTVPPCVSAVSNILANNLYSGWPAVWIALRIAAPLVLIFINSRIFQQIGLTLFVALLVVGMFRW